MGDLWFRCYCDLYRNRKLRNVSETFQLRYLWFLALHKEGKLVGAAVSDIAWELRIPEDEVEAALDALIDAKLLLSDRTPKGWSDRQYNSDVSTERVRKHRGVKRFSNVSETRQSRADTETEQNRAEREQNAPAREPDIDVVQLDPDIVQPDPDRYAEVAVVRAVDFERPPGPRRGRTIDWSKPDAEIIQPSEAQLVMLHDKANAIGQPLADIAAELGVPVSGLQVTRLLNHMDQLLVARKPARASPKSYAELNAETTNKALEELQGRRAAGCTHN